MTFNTIQGFVDSLQKVVCFGFVIPLVRLHILPGVRCVAVPTVGSQAKAVTVVLTAFPVAGLTGKRSAFKNEIEVALAALNSPMFAD